MNFGTFEWFQLAGRWSWLLVAIAAAMVAGILVNSLLFALLRVLAGRTRTTLDDLMVRHGRGPGRLFFPLVLLNSIEPILGLGPEARPLYNHAIGLLLIGACTYLAVNATYLLGAYIADRQEMTAADNLAARRIVTQVRVLQNVALVVIGVLGFSCALMTFDGVRQVGVSLLASAGIAGVVLGFAAQKSIGTLLAGIQIAISQPVRLEDVVVVEGEWGRIEEIALTYVVVRIWDLRRLIVPITYFIEKPFQNWTRVSSEILGTVFLRVDYTVSVGSVREELDRLLAGNDLWDQKVASVQVTEMTPNGLELRVLVSASDASKCWDLRCQLRERLVDFIRREAPGALARVRAEVTAG